MARVETTKDQTPDSLNHLASELESYVAQLRAAAIVLSVEPPIPSVPVKYESSREVGFENVRNWANAAKQAAFEARLAITQKVGKTNGVRKPDASPKLPK